MKKYSLQICSFIIIVLLISCSENSNGIKNNSKPEIADKPDIQVSGSLYNENVYEFTSKGIFFAKDESIHESDFLDYRESWLNQIESMFDIELQWHDNYIGQQNSSNQISVYSSEYSNLIKNGINDGSIAGLYTVFDYQSVRILKEDGYILPIDEYISENSYWNVLPVEWREAFSGDGHVWALPYSFRETVTFRYIRSDWLKNLNLDKPSTVDEFYEVMKHFTYGDPDLDGEDHTFGASFSGIAGLADIFNSFDARLNYKKQVVPSWNPNTNLWEDSFLKPQFSDCLGLLRTMFSEFDIVEDQFLFSNGYSGSTYGRDTVNDIYAKTSILEKRPNNGEPEIEYITGLTHYIDKNLTGYYTEYLNPMVLTKNSQYPASTVNILINNFMSNYEGFMIARFGHQDYPFIQDGDLLIYNDSSDNNYIKSFASPRLVGTSPTYSFYEIENNGNEDDLIASITHAQRIKMALENSLCYKIPNDIINYNISVSMEKKLRALAEVSEGIVMSIIKGKVSFEEGIEHYRSVAKQLGIQEFLDEQNKLLGKISTQYY